MSACAGSLTDGFAVSPLVSPRIDPVHRRRFFKYYAGQVRMDHAPGRIRVHEHAETGNPLHPSDEDLSPGTPERLATNSLQSGYRIVKPVRFVQIVGQDLRHGSPPFRAGRGAETGTPANHGSSLRHISPPSGHARLHPTLPRVPAGRSRWAERYDGKGNMHLQHAA